MYSLVICDSLLLNMAIEIVDLPMKDGDLCDFPWLCKRLPESMFNPGITPQLFNRGMMEVP